MHQYNNTVKNSCTYTISQKFRHTWLNLLINDLKNNLNPSANKSFYSRLFWRRWDQTYIVYSDGTQQRPASLNTLSADPDNATTKTSRQVNPGHRLMSHVRQYITMSVIQLPILIYQRRFKPGGFHNRIFTYTTTVVQWGYKGESSTATAAPKKPRRSDSTRTVPSHCMPHTYTQCQIISSSSNLSETSLYFTSKSKERS